MNIQQKTEYIRTYLFNPGEATSEIIPLDGGGCYQTFENANIYENRNGEAYEVHGLIRNKYIDFHETVGDMGFPASDETDDPDVPGGRMNAFEHGKITWSPDDGVEVTLNTTVSETGYTGEDNHSEGDNGSDSHETQTKETALIVGDWQTVLTNSTSSPDAVAAVINDIRARRDAVPKYVKSMKSGYGYFGKINAKPSVITPDSLEDWIWEEIGSEGAFNSINAYDTMISVTWGKGIADLHLPKLFKALFGDNADLEIAFKSVGIAIGPDGDIQVVKTDDATIVTGKEAFRLMRTTDQKLLDFLADIPSTPEFQNTICQRQWTFVMNFNTGLAQHIIANQWTKDAAQLAFHLSFWLPGYGWLGNPSAYKATNGDPVQIILTFYRNQKTVKNELISHLKTFAGNAFRKYVALEKYMPELPPDQCAIFVDGNATYYVPF